MPDAHLSFIVSKWFESSSVRLLTFWQCEWAEMGVGVTSPSAREIVTAARADVGDLCFGESNLKNTYRFCMLYGVCCVLHATPYSADLHYKDSSLLIAATLPPTAN
jgi:hypothetical protein